MLQKINKPLAFVAEFLLVHNLYWTVTTANFWYGDYYVWSIFRSLL